MRINKANRKEKRMNLKELYQNAKVTYVSGCGYDTTNKERFGRRAVLFLKRACKLANIKPDKRYPYFNRGGPAVLGEVYLTITKPNQSSRIEFIFGEKMSFETGALYRTNSGKFWNNFGQNIWLKETTTEESIAKIIQDFMTINSVIS
jgi:hypothetical protein